METTHKRSSLDDLLGLMHEAHDDMLQEIWDRYLIGTFKSLSKMTMARCVAEFIDREHITVERFHELKRVPKYYRQARCLVTRFVAAYLPALNEKLWDTNWSVDQLIAWLAKNNINTNDGLSDARKYKSEYRQRQTVNRQLARNTLEIKGYFENQDLYKKSNWNQVKAVRAKR